MKICIKKQNLFMVAENNLSTGAYGSSPTRDN